MGNGCSPGGAMLTLVMSYFVLSFFQQDILNEIWDGIESVLDNFPAYPWSAFYHTLCDVL